MEPSLSESLSTWQSSENGRSSRFADMRGVQWRINLGVLPSSPPSSIEDLRRLTADSRRRYATLRRCLLVPPKDGNNSPDLVIDNPLSQNPDSMWGRFFRNAELEKMVDQDLSRLYPEQGSYFQTPGCQGMLRRILLLWCLRNPEFSYRQGMHELLAPLLYVLHVDVEHLSQIRKVYEDHFTDKFDGLAFQENDLAYNFDLKKFSDVEEGENGFYVKSTKATSLHDLNPATQTTVLLSDAYGAEGELGIVVSEKFMEHDAFCMFDALMSGSGGAVAMADFFPSSPEGGSRAGLPPVIEASSALYHLLSLVDSSLHSHLVELKIEPQYFALRWLRLLFGREFSLRDLLLIWDEIFASDNSNLSRENVEGDADFTLGLVSSSRGAFISGIAVSMVLHLRSSLLAAETATSCLQRLLSFPENANLEKLIEKAKSLQSLALYTNMSSEISSYSIIPYSTNNSTIARAHSLSSDSNSPRSPLKLVPDSYWEDKWRVLHKAEEFKEPVPTQKKRWSERLRLSLSRTESDPSASKFDHGKRNSKPSFRRSLLKDLSRELCLEEDTGELSCNHDVADRKGYVEEHSGTFQNFTVPGEERCLDRNAGSEEDLSVSSALTSGQNEQENESEKSSVSSNVSCYDNNDPNNSESARLENSSLSVSDPCEDFRLDSECGNDSKDKSVLLKDRKLLSGKFQWFRKLGWNAATASEETSEKRSGEATKAEDLENDIASSCACDLRGSIITTSTGDAGGQNVKTTLRNLGHSMLENIQVIESALQQDQTQIGSLEDWSKTNLAGKGQVAATAALNELRKISSLLSQM